MKYITKEVRIGIAGIVALCVLIYGINWLKGIHMFQPSSYFYAKFENVNGLTKSSPVFADGVRVGIVRDIYYDYAKPGNVIVEVELDTELRIPKGSSAELVSELMGGVRMNILLANNPREKYAVSGQRRKICGGDRHSGWRISCVFRQLAGPDHSVWRSVPTAILRGRI